MDGADRKPCSPAPRPEKRTRIRMFGRGSGPGVGRDVYLRDADRSLLPRLLRAGAVGWAEPCDNAAEVRDAVGEAGPIISGPTDRARRIAAGRLSLPPVGRA